MKSEDNDFEVAYRLHQQSNCFGLTENAILPKDRNKENYKPRTLVDQTLELIDPTPNIHTLFIQFNERFFWNVLLPVEVKWSTRMTSCAGTCTFHPKNRQCVIALSLPLLKLRPRKDLVETLLHEMIHGYLFLTNNDRDRDGHGPEFCKHMHRINKEAGTKITIYHSFHDEVKLYQQHWWRCNGPCQKKAPYFGTVRRAMNRAPGPTDFWWKEHQQTCGGQFIKIKEPENFKTKGSKKVKSGAKSNNSEGNMFNWLTKAPIISEPLSSSTPKSSLSNNHLLTEFKKLGNSTNNVHGWGTGGPINTINNSHKSNTLNTTSISNTLKFYSSGVLGGSNTGRSNLLNKLYNNNQACDLNTATALSKEVIDTVNIHTTSKQLNNNNRKSPPELQECPVCSTFVLSDEINEHVDICLTTKNENSNKLTTENYNNAKSSSQVEENISFAKKRKNNTHTFSNKQPKLDELQNSRETNCPVCNRVFKIVDINEHLDNCLLDTVEQDNNLVTLNNTNDKNETTNTSLITINSTSNMNPSSTKNSHFNSKFVESDVAKTTSHNCLVCNSFIPSEMSLRDHLEDCIGNVFKDDSSLSIDCDNETISEISLRISVDQSDKYPCPVCMQLISESFMNQHLDTCLQNT